MSLSLHFDHRLDRLADTLIRHFAASPAHPLAEDTVIVPSVGIGRWLQERVAQRTGVCARLRIDFAGRYLWQVSSRLLPGLPSESPFDPATARWSVLQLLDSLPDQPGLEPLARRVAAAAPADRLVLAGEIAALFERYLAWRRDWLVRWQAGAWATGDQPLGVHEAWQRWLWNALLERLPEVGGRHPFERLVELIEADPAQARDRLGDARVAVFGAVGLSPDQLELLARLAAIADVAIFAPDPCRELWSDMLDRASLERVRAQRPDVAWLYESEPSVLGDWGRAQRDLVAQLLALEERVGIQSQAPFRDEGGDGDDAEGEALTRLQALQTAVLERSDQCWSRLSGEPEASLQLHSTHGAIRQAEVLHDCLLECFESVPDLEPGQVAVFCADVDAVGAAIESVFGSIEGPRRIPVSVSGRRAAVDPLIGAALDLLALAAGGVRLSALCAWLDNRVVGEALGLDSREVGDLVAWLEASGARWGLDAVDGPVKHNWQAALDRLLLGAALGGQQAAVLGLAPVAGAQAIAGWLGRLLPAIDAIGSLRDLAGEPRAVADWCRGAQAVFIALFGDAFRGADALGVLLAAVADLRGDAAHEDAVRIDFAGFQQVLTEQLDRGASAASASGAVTVCPIGSLRGVPFRVICLVGMDESAFPRRGMHSEIDLMLRAPRFGDRVARIDDRGAFLDTLLSAGERVLLLYQGRDPRDDSARNPSTVVGELLDYLNAREAPFDRRVEAVQHPLHPFAPRSFAGEPRSYAAQWQATARVLAMPLARRADLAGPLVDLSAWVEPTDPNPEAARADGAAGRESADAVAGEPPDLDLALGDLRRALCDPAQAWLQRALGIRLPSGQFLPTDDEPLWENPGQDDALVADAARSLLAGAPVESVWEGLAVSPATAAGAAGRLQVDGLIDTATGLVARARAEAGAFPDADRPPGAPREPLQVRLRVPGPPGHRVRLSATLEGIDGPHLLRVSPWRIGVGTVVETWLAHAFWTVWLAERRTDPDLREDAPPDPDEVVTRTFAKDGFVELAGAISAERLGAVAAWVRRIRALPIPLFPRSYHAYRAADFDIVAAATAMTGSDYLVGEAERTWVRALYRDQPPSAELAMAASTSVYGPIYDDCVIHLYKRKGKA